MGVCECSCINTNTKIHRNFTNAQANDCIFVVLEKKTINVTKCNERVMQERAAGGFCSIRTYLSECIFSCLCEGGNPCLQKCVQQERTVLLIQF